MGDFKESFIKRRGQTFFVCINLFRSAVCITTNIGFKVHFVLILDESLRHESLPIIVWKAARPTAKRKEEEETILPPSLAALSDLDAVYFGYIGLWFYGRVVWNGIWEQEIIRLASLYNQMFGKIFSTALWYYPISSDSHPKQCSNINTKF